VTFGGSIIQPLSLVIHPWVGAMSNGDGFGHRWGRNVELCVAVGPVTRTAGILAYCMLAQLGLTVAGSKVKGSKLRRAFILCVNRRLLLQMH